MKRIAIFASGSGTNAENLMQNFQHSDICVTHIYCNNPHAGVIARATKYNVPTRIITKGELADGTILNSLIAENIDLIVLAGFMQFIPIPILNHYEDKIINIHPSLLPKYGGKGMFGIHVHEAVIANNETESGITIHLVNEIFDSGEIVFQAKCPVLPTDTPEVLAQRVHQLEYQYYPIVVRQLLEK